MKTASIGKNEFYFSVYSMLQELKLFPYKAKRNVKVSRSMKVKKRKGMRKKFVLTVKQLQRASQLKVCAGSYLDRM